MGAMSAWRGHQQGGMTQPAKVRKPRRPRPRKPNNGVGGGGGKNDPMGQTNGAAAGQAGELAVGNSPQEAVNALLRGGGITDAVTGGEFSDFYQNGFYQNLYDQFTTNVLYKDEEQGFAKFMQDRFGVPLVGQDAEAKAKGGKKRKKKPVDPAVQQQQYLEGAAALSNLARSQALQLMPGQKNGGNRFDPTASQQGRWSWWD